jgi:hypothetical protein
MNQTQENHNFFTPFFNFKLKKLKNIINIFYNKYKYDLFFRFPKNSLKTSAKFIKYFNLKITKKYSIFKKKNIKPGYIFFRTPTTGSFGNYFNIIFKRAVYLITGSFNYLPLNYTYSGYYIPFITRKKRKKFIEKISKFLFIKKYNLLENKLKVSYKKYKLYYVFFNQKPNINLSILFFVTSKKKINFLEYSSLIKQYKLFSKKYKNLKFFKFS